MVDFMQPPTFEQNRPFQVPTSDLSSRFGPCLGGAALPNFLAAGGTRRRSATSTPPQIAPPPLNAKKAKEGSRMLGRRGIAVERALVGDQQARPTRERVWLWPA
jgi:hypothetical protein